MSATSIHRITTLALSVLRAYMRGQIYIVQSRRYIAGN
jgi:hypothetical protein